jgi:EAL domain-containing protein (putative c-di-GMP-specific phosphodiesterase class I)
MKHAVFDSEMHERAVIRLRLETDMQRAVEREEFRLMYQPLVDLDDDNRIMGFEALIRWQHPVQGLLPPAAFLTVAEETSLIVPIGYWVLREACTQLHQWHQEFPTATPLVVSVNLSSKQFSDPALVEEIDKIIDETGVDAHSLWLEITESVVMENPRAAREMLAKLKLRGLHVCLDDFGTGHSTLGHLHRLPIDTLKIDRSFVSSIGEHGEDSEIVRVILTLAEHLGLDVVAEGIETEMQANQLRELNSHIGQGFYFSKPLTTAAVEALWSNEPGRFGLIPALN